MDHERALMKLLLMISLVVAGFLIFATLSMMVTEKTRDIGILTALGATRTGILYIFLFCGFVISFLGSLLGSLAGWISCLYLNDFNEFLGRTFHVQLFPPQIYNLSRIPTELDLGWILQVVAGAILLSLLFSLIPAFRASRFEPVKALRYE
ncbi:MAG TPA: FtsX-like permease family protein [Planctomycetes bacterium]|nr:FtsX-like permease family protein [Planctomycetota bacterium]